MQQDQRTHNLPTAEEISVIILEEGVHYAMNNRDMVLHIRLANSKAGIKPTAPLSVFDKENSMEFLLDFLHYLYNYYMVYALLSHTYHVM